MQKQEKHVPCVNDKEWMEADGTGIPREKARLEGKLIEVIADYKHYIKEASADEDMLIKIIQDQDASQVEARERWNAEKAKLLRKIADIQDGWDTQLQVTQCQLNEVQDKFKEAIRERDIVRHDLEEVTKERDWFSVNQADDADTIDRLWKKNKKLKRKIKIIKRKIKIIKELMKC